MHDGTINRTCRNPDGSKIDRPIEVSKTTYAELLQYDAGIAMGEKFRGTKIPRLDELLAEAEGRNVIIALDKKIPTDNIDALLDVTEKYNTKVCFSTSDTARIKKIQERIPNARFDYDVNLEDEALEEVCRLVKPENLIVWMYLDKPNFSWLVQKAKVSPENYARVKKYARVGIANVNNPQDVKAALDYAPDILEI
jgi:glycerophosphoryl diester phosphodiesterase